MAERKDKKKVIGEPMTDEQIKVFLQERCFTVDTCRFQNHITTRPVYRINITLFGTTDAVITDYNRITIGIHRMMPAALHRIELK